MNDNELYTMITQDIGIKKNDGMYCNWIISRVFEKDKSSMHLTDEEIAELKAFLNKQEDIKVLKKVCDEDRKKIEDYLAFPHAIELEMHDKKINIYEYYDGEYKLKIDGNDIEGTSFWSGSFSEIILTIEAEINK